MGTLPCFGLNGHVPSNRVWFGGVLRGERLRFWSLRDVPTIFLEFGWGKGKKGLAPIVQKVDREALLKGLRMSLV